MRWRTAHKRARRKPRRFDPWWFLQPYQRNWMKNLVPVEDLRFKSFNFPSGGVIDLDQDEQFPSLMQRRTPTWPSPEFIVGQSHSRLHRPGGHLIFITCVNTAGPALDKIAAKMRIMLDDIHPDSESLSIETEEDQ